MIGDPAATSESVESTRFDRLILALTHASVRSFVEATALAGALQEDRFGAVEESLAIFLEDLQRTDEERAAATVALEGSRRELEQQLATIRRQQTAIRELSTPMIEVWDGVVALPFVGVLDSERAAEAIRNLLERLAGRGDQCVIVDLTGIEGVDVETAGRLITLVRCARLLGAFCVLTGVRPELAKTLVHLDVDLGGMLTRRTLKEGLWVCLDHMGQSHRRPA
jgi:rsbT co-antagonist protein RsbR